MVEFGKRYGAYKEAERKFELAARKVQTWMETRHNQLDEVLDSWVAAANDLEDKTAAIATAHRRLE